MTETSIGGPNEMSYGELLDQSRIVQVPARLYVQMSDDGPQVVNVTVSPMEGDAGYFGHRQTTEFWDHVSDYLDSISQGSDPSSTRYPLAWEG